MHQERGQLPTVMTQVPNTRRYLWKQVERTHVTMHRQDLALSVGFEQPIYKYLRCWIHLSLPPAACELNFPVCSMLCFALIGQHCYVSQYNSLVGVLLRAHQKLCCNIKWNHTTAIFGASVYWHKPSHRLGSIFVLHVDLRIEVITNLHPATLARRFLQNCIQVQFVYAVYTS